MGCFELISRQLSLMLLENIKWAYVIVYLSKSITKLLFVYSNLKQILHMLVH